jgi:hypothetical protein
LGKFANIFETLTFNIIMSMVALAALAKFLIEMIAARSFEPGGLLFIIWIVIAYHFLSASITALQARPQ